MALEVQRGYSGKKNIFVTEQGKPDFPTGPPSIMLVFFSFLSYPDFYKGFKEYFAHFGTNSAFWDISSAFMKSLVILGQSQHFGTFLAFLGQFKHFGTIFTFLGQFQRFGTIPANFGQFQGF